MNNIQKNNNELFSNFIKEYDFNILHTHLLPDKIQPYNFIRSDKSIELIIRPECNQHCDYCYIANYGQELYPLEERVSNETLISNLHMFLIYLLDNKIIPYNFQIFAGDLFYDDLFYQITEELLEYVKAIYKDEKQYLINTDIPLKFIVPTNFSFVNNESHLSKLKDLQRKFKEYNTILHFSASVDGKYCSFIREKKQPEEVDDYYDKIFTAIDQLDAGMHPMISSEGIETYIQNFDWWNENLIKHHLDSTEIDYMPMFLEVRNEGWTEEKVQSYLALLQHMVNFYLKLCNNSIEDFAYFLFEGDGKNNTFKQNLNYSPILLTAITNKTTETFSEKPGCTFATTLMITLNNLKIVPCHRLAYPIFAGGQFKVENDKITDIISINPTAYIGLHTLNISLVSKCAQCPIKGLCIKGCYGAQFEAFGNPLIQIPSICNLMHEKIKFLLTTYNNMGVLKELFIKKYNTDYYRAIILAVCDYYNIKINLEV